MIELRNLSYHIQGTTILDRFSWKVEKEQHALIVGASGSGKTTLLHLLAGLLTPDSGMIAVDGLDIATLSDTALDKWRGRNIGMVFQTLHLVKALTVRDNLRLARSMAGLTPEDARIDYLLKSLGLIDKSNHYPHQLSVGQAQRVAIARAIINQPAWVLADEPTSALDDANCAEILDLLESHAKECGATLIIATHDQRVKNRYTHRLELHSTSIRQAA